MARRKRATATHQPTTNVVESLTGGSSGTPPMPAPTYDSQYWNELASGQSAYDTTLAGINLGRGRIAFDTGFGPDGQVDLSNPYNQALMLQRSYEQAQKGINTSMAAQGQLYSGARRTKQREAAFQFERNRSNLATSAQRGYENLSLDQTGAGNDLTNSQYAAAANQAGRWQDQKRDWFALYG